MFLTLVLFSISPSFAIKFDGPCPAEALPELTKFRCLETRYGLPDSFRVVAHLPSDPQTRNIFYTPFNHTCLSLVIGCEYLSVSQIYIQQHCFDSAIHYTVYCDPVSVNLAAKNDSPSIIRFGKDLQSKCATEVAEYKLGVKFSIKGKYWVIYGCREIVNLENQLSHDEGAWVLVSKTQVQNFSQDLLTKAIDEDLKGITAKRSDFLITNLTALDEDCDFEWKYCKYFHDCPTKEKPAQNFNYEDHNLDMHYSDYNYLEYHMNDNLTQNPGDNGQGLNQVAAEVTVASVVVTEGDRVVERETSTENPN